VSNSYEYEEAIFFKEENCLKKVEVIFTKHLKDAMHENVIPKKKLWLRFSENLMFHITLVN